MCIVFVNDYNDYNIEYSDGYIYIAIDSYFTLEL